MLKAIFFDMDDTLIVNQVLYDNARFLLAGYLSNFGVTPAETAKAIDDIDPGLFKIHGITRFRYPATFEAVLKHFIPNADADMVKTVRGFAESVFSTVAPVKPGTEDALNLLGQHYDLYIVTAGDDVVQQNRVSLLPFRDKFKEIFIVAKKDKQAYVDVLAKLGLKPEETLMAGDSLKSDVIPAIEAGMVGVHIPASVSGAYHPLHSGPISLPEKGAYGFSSMLELARHLSEHGSAESKKFRLAPPPKKPDAPKI